MDIEKDHYKFYVITRAKLGISAADIVKELTEAWDNECPSDRTIRRWFKQFKDEQMTSLKDLPRCGRPRSSRTEKMIEDVQELIRSTGNKWRTLRSNPIHLNELFWQMDNARPHTSMVVQDYLEDRNMKTIWQSPYSPDFNLCDRFLFQWMKSELRKKTFEDHQEVQQHALQVLRDISEESLHTQVDLLLAHCQRVIDANGDYITE